jgi:hypothetical protein
MKHFTMMTAAVLFVLGTNAQTAIEDSVELGTGYANSVFYKLNDGSETLVDNANWDLAFTTGGFGTTIRINGQAGTQLWQYPSGAIGDWATVDTTGITSWTRLYDSSEHWSAGAFDEAAGSDPFDVGWGLYNVQTHIITGDKIFIIKLSNGEYQKLIVEDLTNGVFTFRHANLEGGADMTHTLDKADFTDKNFGYFSLQNHTDVDREPVSADWDLVFQKYEGLYAPGVHYGVTGVLTNEGVYATEARGVVASEADYTNYESDSLTNTIGWDWKDLNAQWEYEVEDSLSYFISDVEGNIWQIVFTAFAGSSTGKVWFDKTLLSTTGINDAETKINVAVYPNPSSDGNVSLVFNLEENEAIANVYDMTGKLVANHTFQGQGFKQRNLNLHGLPAGTYLLRLQTAQHVTTSKIILK